MDEQVIRDIMSGRRRGAGAALLRAALSAASAPYAAAMRLRRAAYSLGWVKSHAASPFCVTQVQPTSQASPECQAPRKNASTHQVKQQGPSTPRETIPVICVGNITTGGTGKTPMVAHVVELLKGMGRRPGILTRGYKAVAGQSDEAELLRRLCGPEVPVIVNSDRVTGAAAAVAAGADVLVMDDGFQHLRLRRDLNIVLIDAAEPFGYGHCLPRGMLREPPEALRDAHALVITRSDAPEPEELDALRRRLAKLAPRASIHLAAHVPTAVGDISTNAGGASADPATLAGKRVFAFCGLANPESFFASLEKLGAIAVGRRALADHAAYDAALLAELNSAAVAAGAEALVTTQKDGVKLSHSAFSLPCLELAVRMGIVEGAEELAERIRGILNQLLRESGRLHPTD